MPRLQRKDLLRNENWNMASRTEGAHVLSAITHEAKPKITKAAYSVAEYDLLTFHRMDLAMINLISSAGA